MKISTKIKASFILSAMIIVVSILLIWKMNRHTEKLMIEFNNYNESIKTMFELSFLTGALCEDNEQRIFKQWLKSFEKLDTYFNNLPNNTLLQKQTKIEMINKQLKIKELFEHYKRIKHSQACQNSRALNHIKYQIEVNIRALIDQTDLTKTNLHKTMMNHRFYLQTFILLYAFLIMAICAYWISSIRKNILLPIQQFCNSFNQVKEQDFSVQIHSQYYEEFNIMVASFNSMVETLERTTTSKNELSKEVEERKEAERKLQEALKEVKLSNEDLAQFAYVASHDLQEPLRMVASYTQLLACRYKDKLDEDANDFIDFAVNGAIRMQTLITDLLEYSRIGTHGKAMKAVDLDHVFKTVLENLTVSIQQNNVKIDIDKMPKIPGDESQLIQLFQNLISNSIKFKSSEEPLIQIQHKLENDNIIISVKDNGIGIDPKYFERVFTIFQRLHAKEDYEGTGIGLAVCKKIIERHQGRIWIESAKNNGTTFYIQLKVEDNGGQQDEQQS